MKQEMKYGENRGFSFPFIWVIEAVLLVLCLVLGVYFYTICHCLWDFILLAFWAGIVTVISLLIGREEYRRKGEQKEG